MNMPAQGSDAWLRQREGKLTASVIGKVINGDGKEVMRDMVREALGYPRAFTGNVATDYGHQHEDEARTEYALTTGNAVSETGFHAHPDIEWMGASPDGLVGSDGLLEIKCPFKLRDADAVPDELLSLDARDLYWHQMQCQMHVMHRKWCDFAVWCPGEIRIERYHRDGDWMLTALDAGNAFMDELNAILADADEAERIADMKRDMSGDDKWRSLALDFRNLDAEAKRIKALQDEVKAELIELAAERRASGAGISVSPVTRSGGVDYKAMADAAGVDPEQYRKPASTSWQIRISNGEKA
ncbi:lambda exonuclease family protein [Vreelandella maris]|uniref:lambda exonuclease family protein n=1 Tax=Vreelandella maris TaxID=2729617 RepID=UPI0030EC0DA4|tara:strand:+ start:1251 stop:2147 length:897 start_codon:yes stop_codon:yes gene_type:complete